MLGDFEIGIQELIKMDGTSPWSLFLGYREALLRGQVGEALNNISELRERNLPRGVIPLSKSELIPLEVQLKYFGDLLAIPESDPENFPWLTSVCRLALMMKKFGPSPQTAILPSRNLEL